MNYELCTMNSSLAVLQDLSGAKYGVALDVVEAAEFVDGGAALACDGGKCLARFNLMYACTGLCLDLLN